MPILSGCENLSLEQHKKLAAYEDGDESMKFDKMVNTKTKTTAAESTEPKFDLSKVPARVERVNVCGLLRTHNDYVMHAADGLFKAGNFQDVMLEAMKAKQYLHELGIFKDVKVQIDISHGENVSPDGYEVTLKGKELSRFVGSIGTEVGQSEGSLRTELTIPNIFGRGERLSLQGSYSSTYASDLSLKFWKSFYHTRFLNNRPEVSFSLFRHLDQMDLSSFQNANLGINADFSFKTILPFELTHSLQYEASVRELSLLAKTAPFVVREHCGPKLASLIRYIVSYDQRDNPVFPKQGIMLKSVNEYCGLGGNVAYRSHTAHAEMNVPLFAGFVAQICGRVATIHGTKRTTILPINNLYYCGGPLTLRGFKYGGAGPVVDGTPIGAEIYWSTGLHLWAPLPFNHIFKDLANNFRTHLFYNFGNYKTFSTENMRSSAGIGLAFKFAERARIEFNYCIPIRKCPSDKAVDGFQFGIGCEFV